MHRVNGWYPVADSLENKLEGKAFVSTKDFAEVFLDTVSFSGMAVIEGLICLFRRSRNSSKRLMEMSKHILIRFALLRKI